jgi:hypothetical protein
MNPLHRRNHDGAPALTQWELIAAVASHFIEPCLPSPGERPPTGPDWVHEIKHDGYRLMARRDPVGIRLITRNRPLAACGLSHRSPGTPGRVRKASLFSSEWNQRWFVEL